MRILFVTHHASLVAGVETYVAGAIGALATRGHDVALLAEEAPVPGRDPIDGARVTWSASSMGEATAVAGAREWTPDIAFVHGLRSAWLEEAVLDLAPAVLFAHGYAGLCISGSRTWQTSDACCPRRLGPMCLAHYFPHRCGGRSPLTLVRDYAQQRALQRRRRQYRVVVTASRHVAGVLDDDGFPRAAIRVLPLPVPAPVASVPRDLGRPPSLVYAGRLEHLKGVHLLAGAAALAARSLGRHIELHIAGDGPLRPLLIEQAGAVASAVRFIQHGWQSPARRDEIFSRSDLLLMPSLWPEPFGLGGLEAARFGVPTAAFASGGICEWLQDGINGRLAPERTEAGLASAIASAFGEERAYRQLSTGALRAAAAASPDAHAARLERVFEEALA